MGEESIERAVFGPKTFTHGPIAKRAYITISR